MKNIVSALVISVVSSAATLGIYKVFFSEGVKERVIIRNEQEAKFAKNPMNESPFSAPDISNVESFKGAADIARPAVVHIESTSGNDIFDMGGASGSGVILTSDGYIITNNHVIEDADKLTVTLNDKRTYSAKVIGTDPSTDLAVIKVSKSELKGKDLPFLNIGNSDEVHVGEWVLAVGNPFNLTSTVTAGIVSAKGRNIDILEGIYSVESFIQTDAAVNPGNSGGALIDTEGNLVGINTAIITRSGRYEGYSFAVPVNLAKKVADDIIEFGSVQRGFLGVTIKDITNEMAENEGLNSLDGVYIDRVNSGSAAEEGGIERHDIITRVNGVVVRSSPELQEQIAMFRPGNTIKIEYLRAGVTYETELTLKNKSNTTDLAERRADAQLFQNKETILKDLGIEASALSEAEQKKTEQAGVRVTEINRGSLIERTNMEVDFIITEVNDQTVTTIDEFIEAIYDANDKVVLDGFYEEYPGEYSYVFSKEE